MAAVIASAAGELAALLGSSTVEKSIAGSLIGFAASDVAKAIYDDLTGGNPSAKANAARAPRYALVDLHNNTIIRTMSPRKVYSILTHPSRRRRNGRTTIIREVKVGSEHVR